MDIDENVNINSDVIHPWTSKSEDIQFKSTKSYIGNGEEKLAKELDILTVGGQNCIADLTHPVIGKISVKDMTNDDCILGTEGCQTMRTIFRKIINPFVCWIEKYKSDCEIANSLYYLINNKYGSSRTTIMEGIDRYELSKTNLCQLNQLFDKLKEYNTCEIKTDSLKSEYIHDIINNLGDKSLQNLLDDCVRTEAIDMTLIIVYENIGWLIVKDVSRLTCPRITRGSPRINYTLYNKY